MKPKKISVEDFRPDDPSMSQNRTSVSRRIRRWFYHRLSRAMMLFHNLLLSTVKIIGPRKRSDRPKEGWDILLTGSFYADNWIKSLLMPLIMAEGCKRVVMVSTSPVPNLPKLQGIRPPKWMIRLLGPVIARLITFTVVAIRTRPDYVGGFAMLANGLTASIIAPMIGARSMYICVGGPKEVQDGGIGTERGPLARMETPDPVVEKRLMRVADSFDLIVTMGTGAGKYFRENGVETRIHPISGGIDSREFKPAKESPSIDLILVGRLSEIKRVDLFLHAVKQVSKTMPDVRAVVVGTGRLQSDLERLAIDLQIDHCAEILGFQKSVSQWVARSKMFVLTSDSEGLSLALIEAMMCGLPAIVSNVGDLGDLVKNNVNGYLIDQRNPEAFAEKIVSLLKNQNKLKAFSQAARQSAIAFDISSVSRKWDEALLQQPPTMARRYESV